MRIVLPVCQEDLQALANLTANIYGHEVKIQATYAHGMYQSILDGERGMMDKVASVAGQVDQSVRKLCYKWNYNAKITVQENRQSKSR